MSEPLSEERLREIERQVEGDAVPSRGELWKCSEDLLAEVRRLRALFTAEDARLCVSAAKQFSLRDEDGVYSDLTSDLDDLAARLREARDTGEQPHTPEEP